MATVAATLAPYPAIARTDVIEALYRRSIVLDSLMGTESPAMDVDGLRRAGITGGNFDLKTSPRDPARAEALLRNWQMTFARVNSPFLQVKRADDFAVAKASGKIAVTLGSQDASILGTPGVSTGFKGGQKLRDFYGLGLRILQLTYTNSNGLGSGYSESVVGGLTRFGSAVVTLMNQLGMLIDVSHCAEPTTLDAIAQSSRPVAVTHGGCYELFPDARNKSDLVIRRVADKGGYFGVYNMTVWMTAKPTASVEDVVDHVDHVVKIGGVDLIGFGSDHPPLGEPMTVAEQLADIQSFVDANRGYPGGKSLTGQVTAADLDGPDRMLVLARALSRRGYKEAAIEKFLGGNFIRAFRDACG